MHEECKNKEKFIQSREFKKREYKNIESIREY